MYLGQGSQKVHEIKEEEIFTCSIVSLDICLYLTKIQEIRSEMNILSTILNWL